MFIDYLTLMLANMSGALFIFALYTAFFYDTDPRKAVPGFLLTGGIALITGFAMILTWPLPGQNNIMMGEPTVMLGAVFLMAGLSINFGWNLLTVGIYSLGAGAVAILLGIRILDMGLSKQPLVSGLGYIAAGAAAVLALPGIALPKAGVVRWVAAVIAVIAAGIWAFTGFSSYWGHLESFARWVPATMTPPPAAPSN